MGVGRSDSGLLGMPNYLWQLSEVETEDDDEHLTEVKERVKTLRRVTQVTNAVALSLEQKHDEMENDRWRLLLYSCFHYVQLAVLMCLVAVVTFITGFTVAACCYD